MIKAGKLCNTWVSQLRFQRALGMYMVLLLQNLCEGYKTMLLKYHLSSGMCRSNMTGIRACGGKAV